MADSKLTALTENTSPVLSDLLYQVDDPAGTPLGQKVTIANILALASIGITSVVDVATNQTPATTDKDKLYNFTIATAADRTLTLPSVGASEDGYLFWIQNSSAYMITVQPSDTDSVWRSGAGYGIELLPETLVCLRYKHASTRFDIINKQGGMVRLEGLRLHLAFNTSSIGYTPGTTSYDRIHMNDEVNRHIVYGDNNFRAYLSSASSSAKFGASYLDLDGSIGFLQSEDSPDWSAFGTTSDTWTIVGWVRFDNVAGSYEMILSQYSDGGNYWRVHRTLAGALSIVVRLASVTTINIAGGNLAQNTWHQFVVVHVAAETGLYLDGAQIGYASTFTAGDVAGSLYLGQDGAGANFVDGCMDDIVIANQNLFDAAPNVGKTDTLSNWDKQFVGVQ